MPEILLPEQQELLRPTLEAIGRIAAQGHKAVKGLPGEPRISGNGLNMHHVAARNFPNMPPDIGQHRVNSALAAAKWPTKLHIAGRVFDSPIRHEKLVTAQLATRVDPQAARGGEQALGLRSGGRVFFAEGGEFAGYKPSPHADLPTRRYRNPNEATRVAENGLVIAETVATALQKQGAEIDTSALPQLRAEWQGTTNPDEVARITHIPDLNQRIYGPPERYHPSP